MTCDQMSTAEHSDTAALYALGMLDDAAALSFSEHLKECEPCRAEVRAFDETTAQLSLSATEATPREELRERVLKSVQYVVTRANDGAWLPFRVPGIDTRMLADDPVSGTRTFLLRLEPNAVLPSHSHAYAEHCYVLEGDVFDQEHTLYAGDYELRLAGSAHLPISSRGGAVVLIVTGRHQ